MLTVSYRAFYLLVGGGVILHVFKVCHFYSVPGTMLAHGVMVHVDPRALVSVRFIRHSRSLSLSVAPILYVWILLLLFIDDRNADWHFNAMGRPNVYISLELFDNGMRAARNAFNIRRLSIIFAALLNSFDINKDVCACGSQSAFNTRTDAVFRSDDDVRIMRESC